MRPQQPTRERSLHLGADALIRDLNEALEVSLMLRLELVPQSEHIHEHTYLPAASSRRHCWAAPATTIAHLLSPPRAVAQDNPAAPLRRTPPEAPTEPTDRLIRYWMSSSPCATHKTPRNRRRTPTRAAESRHATDPSDLPGGTELAELFTPGTSFI